MTVRLKDHLRRLTGTLVLMSTKPTISCFRRFFHRRCSLLFITSHRDLERTTLMVSIGTVSLRSAGKGHPDWTCHGTRLCFPSFMSHTWFTWVGWRRTSHRPTRRFCLLHAAPHSHSRLSPFHFNECFHCVFFIHHFRDFALKLVWQLQLIVKQFSWI